MAKNGKNVVITAEAREAIAAGMPEDEAIAQFGAEDTSAEDNEGKPAAAAEGGDTPEGAPAGDPPAAAAEGGDTPAAAAEGGDTPAAAAADEGTVAYLSKQVTELNDKLVDVRTELNAVKAENDRMKASSRGLMDIAASSVKRMQIAMGGTAHDLSHMDPATLLEQHAAIEKAFMERYPIGGKAAVSEDKPDTSLVTESNPSVVRATSFKPKTKSA